MPEESEHENEDMIVWPRYKKAEDVDLEDLGYGDAAPATSHQTKVPRRSSLKSNDIESTYRRASLGYSGEITLTLPNKQTVVRRTSIAWNDDDTTVHSISTHSSYDDDEEEEAVTDSHLWFQKQEYKYIEAKIREDISKYENEGERPTWMERFVGDQEDRKMAVRSVLMDQERQKAAGIYDEECIATEYSFMSMDAQEIAEMKAQRDAAEVQEYLKTTKLGRRQCRRSSC